jgi:two-component system phosphate regulon sensor histidine kinase PhoR
MLIALLVAALLFARMRAAKRLGELRAGFVSTVSHELRTPIASVRMLAELLDQGRVEEQEKPEMHAALAREAQRLGDTVDRLLGFSRMEAGRHVIEREHVSIAALLDRSIATFEERHPEMSPVLRHYPASLSGYVDESQLQLAVDNLLSNASKYAPLGTPYEVRAREEGGFVILEVADHGPGIPRRDRQRVLRPFERGDDRLSTQVQGSGIGLSLVDHVARAHGGEVQVVAEPGGGACVRLRFARRVE